jgi:uncharacterized protein (TIGR02246 family)
MAVERVMTTRWISSVSAALLLMAGLAFATPCRADGPDAMAIRQVMAQQADAWNRGDIAGYMNGYADSPATTFVSSSVRKGYRAILESYRRHYADRAQMGQLTFSELDVRLLKAADGVVRHAVVTGRFHLARSVRGAAGQDDGVFSLVWEKTPAGWKIILDHTS